MLAVDIETANRRRVGPDAPGRTAVHCRGLAMNAGPRPLFRSRALLGAIVAGWALLGAALTAGFVAYAGSWRTGGAILPFYVVASAGLAGMAWARNASAANRWTLGLSLIAVLVTMINTVPLWWGSWW
jgi:hypothetical protein